MEQQLEAALALPSVGYVDAMYETIRRMGFSYVGREMQSVSSTRLAGGRAAVVDRGGYAAASFTDLADVAEAVRQAERSARLVAAAYPTNHLAPAPVVQDRVEPEPAIDFRRIDFDEKRRLLEGYLELALAQPGIFTVLGSYSETETHKVFVSSEGSRIEQTILLCRMGIRFIAKDGAVQESIGLGLGYDSDFSRLKGRQAEVEARAKIAADLLRAEPVAPGVYDVVCDNDLGGTFTHEAFGHLSESDDTWNNPSLRESLKIGRRMGRPALDILDDGTIPGVSGSFAYDEEGVPASRTYLIRDGILVGRLYSRLSAAALDGAPTGNFRATDYRYLPVVRQSNIFIDAGQHGVDELMDSVGDGLYLCGGKGGQTMGDLFTFGAQYGYRLKNGKPGRMVKDINISGNVFETLANISLIADDLRFSEAGGCGKTRAGLFDMQMLEKSGLGGPHIRVDGVVIGG